MNKIIVADGYPMMRDFYLINLPKNNIEVLCVVGNEKDLLHILRVTKPEVLLFNLNIKKEETSDLFTKIRTVYPKMNILVLCEWFVGCLKTNYLRRGALGFLHGNCTGDKMEILLDAIKKVSNGEQYFCKHDSTFLETYPFIDLEFTDTEIKVAQLLYNEHSLVKISKEMNISLDETKKYRETIYTKLKADTLPVFIQAYTRLKLDLLAV